MQCSTGKVAVCGNDPEVLYHPATGALLPTAEAPRDLADPDVRAAFDGDCPDGTRRVCAPTLGGEGDENCFEPDPAGPTCTRDSDCGSRRCDVPMGRCLVRRPDGTACGDGVECVLGSCSVCRLGCRPRPACQAAAGQAPTCANGQTAVCLMGINDEIPTPVDSGPPPDDAGVDAGDTDAGDTDAGDTDAGDTDAGDTDAGDTDAGAADAATDAGDTDAGTDGG